MRAAEPGCTGYFETGRRLVGHLAERCIRLLLRGKRRRTALEVEQIAAKDDRGAGDGEDVETLGEDQPRRKCGKRDAKEIERHDGRGICMTQRVRHAEV